MEDAWALACPCTGGKRPRSPVEKLADLQGQADAEDEANWRSSKRYFTEVISNGFSKLTFGRGLQLGSEQHSAQVISITSPRGHAAAHGCNIQLPAALTSPREEVACDMDMQVSPTQRRSPTHRRSPTQRRSPGSKHHRPPSLSEIFAGSAGSPVCSPTAGSSIYSPPQQISGSDGGVLGSNRALPLPAWQIAAGPAGTAASPPAVSPALPKQVLKTAEKPPHSPSDLPTSGGNLRKVALLRSLLARTEQHLQQQQIEQQQQQQHEQEQHMLVTSTQPQLSVIFANSQHQRQQEQLVTSHSQDKHLAAGEAAEQQGCNSHLLQVPLPNPQSSSAAHAAGAPALTRQASHSTTPSDAMECSSHSSGDSDSSEEQSGRNLPVIPPQSDADLAAASLLCTEVLPFGNSRVLNYQQQPLRQCGQYHSPLPFAQQTQQPPVLYGPVLPPAPLGCFAAHQPQHHSCPGSLTAAEWPVRQQQPAVKAQEQQQGRQQLKATELLSKDRLERLRAKALASTSKLTDLPPEDLHSLQISISASKARRGSVDHTPSNLQDGQAKAEVRRHSSHI